MEDCIFCKIIKGEIPAQKVYEDESVLAFLDIHPIRTGHTLVIPKKHASDFYKLDEQNYAVLMKAVKQIAVRVDEILKPKKVGMLVAGWDVEHAHVHVVPMQEYHDITSKSILDGHRSNPTQEELASTAAKLLIVI